MVDADERTINEVFRPYAMAGRPYMMGVGFDNDGNLIGPWTVKLLPGPVDIRKLGVKQFFGYADDKGAVEVSVAVMQAGRRIGEDEALSLLQELRQKLEEKGCQIFLHRILLCDEDSYKELC